MPSSPETPPSTLSPIPIPIPSLFLPPHHYNNPQIPSFHTPPSPCSIVTTTSTHNSFTSTNATVTHSSLPQLPEESFFDESLIHTPPSSPLPLSSPPPTPPATCVVCMDGPKDMSLFPCLHSHVCLSCFQRSTPPVCPVCRTPVTSVKLLSTNVQLPLSVIMPKPRPERTIRHPSRPPSHRLEYDTYSIYRRTNSLTSVARQAESSVRVLPRRQNAAFRMLREHGSVDLEVYNGSVAGSRDLSPGRRSSASSSGSEGLENSALVQSVKNVVLVGHSRKMMVALAQRLESTFQPVDGAMRREKSTLYIDGEPVRLVLIECPLFAMEPQLVARIQRHDPKVVLLCADFFNVSSFESIVRLDMEMLDYLNISSVWVLVKSTSTKKKSNFVEDADVRSAKHFLGKPRKCFVAQVDGPLHGIAMRKLGLHVHRTVGGGDDDFKAPPRVEQNPNNISNSPRTFSFFCIRAERQQKTRKRDPRRYSQNLGRCLF